MFSFDRFRLPHIDDSAATLLVVVITAVAATPAVYFFLRRRQKYHLHHGRSTSLPYPPGPKGRFLVGNLWEFPDASKGGQLDKKLLEWSLKFGLLFTLRIPVLGPMLVCADPVLVKHIANHPRNFPKSRHAYRLLRPVIGSQSMVALEGPEWSAKRKAFNPGFAPTFLKSMVITMAEKLTRMVTAIEQDIQKEESTHMLQRAQSFTSDVIVAIAFGEDWGGTEPHPARVWLSEISDLVQAIMFRPLLQLFGITHKRQISSLERRLDEAMRAILERRLDAIESGRTAESPSNPHPPNAMDICSLAIDQIRREKGQLSEEDKISISHQLKTFYFAGHDTTAILIAWTMWLLSLHPTVLSKVHNELAEHQLWRVPDSPPTYEQLQACTYLEAVLKETLRLYPPVGGVVRHSMNPSECYQGYAIGGVEIVLSAYVLHHHPSLWKQPEDFRPERFLDGSEENIHDKFLAFSRGPRDCIGKHFAILEAKLAVSALASRFDMDCVNPNESIYSQVTNQPMHGAQVRFKSRATL